MTEITGDNIAGLLLPAWFLLTLIVCLWDMRRYRKRFPNAPLFHWRKIKPSSQQKTCSNRTQPINTDSAGSLTRESMFKDDDSYRPPQDTTFDRPYNFDQPSYMDHNINGVPMSGGIDMHGNPMGSTEY